MSSDVMKGSNFTPMARWEGEPADPTILADSFRFPYACNVVTPNRLMKSAMSEQLATFVKDDMSKSGIPTEELINLYRKFGEGGFGTIVTGGIMVNGRDLEAPGNVIIDKDFDSEERRDAFKRWTAAGKAHGSLMIAQLFHPGKYAATLPNKSNFDINTVTREEIKKLIEEYAFAAKFAQDCGFDGVEIASAYFYTLGQFLTDGANSRTDEYGGSLENRSRLLFSIMQKLRMRLPRQNNFVFGVKFYSGNFEPGYNGDEFSDFVHSVEKTGFDYVTITGGHYNLLRGLPKDGSGKHEHFYQTVVPAIKRNLTRTKLFMNGNFVTLSDMCDAVKERWTAGISLAKPVAAEPDLPKKLLALEVRGGVKSLIDPIDFLAEQQVAGTQLWQHGMNLEVMDPSNPVHVEEFNKALAHFNELQLHADETGADKVVGYPRLIVQDSHHPYGDVQNIYAIKLAAVPTAPPAQLEEKFEEEIHEVTEKDLEHAPSPAEMHEQTISDTFRSYEKRYEDNGNVEIVEESFERVTTSNIDYVEPPKETQQEAGVEEPQHGLKTEFEEAIPEPEKYMKQVLDEAVKAVLEHPEEEVKVELEGTVPEPEHMKQIVDDALKAVLEHPEQEVKVELEESAPEPEHLKQVLDDAVKAVLEPAGEVEAEVELHEVKKVEEPSALATAESPSIEEYWKENFGDGAKKVISLEEPEAVHEEIALKLHEEFTEAQKEILPKEEPINEGFGDEVRKEIHEDLGAAPTAEESLPQEKSEKSPVLLTKAELKETLHDIITDITTFNHLEEGALKTEEQVPVEKAVQSGVQEIIAGITADSKEIIAGLQEEKDVEVVSRPAEPQAKEIIAGITSDNKEIIAGLQEAKEPEAIHEPAELQKIQLTSDTAQQPEDVEEKFEKVVLENISLAGLISDLITSSLSDEAQSKAEIPAPEQEVQFEKIQALPDEKEPEAKPTETFEEFAKVEASSQQFPADVEEKFEKVVLENISLAGLISDLILPSSSEETRELEEVPQTEQKTEAEKVQELPIEKEPEVKLEAAPELETSAKVEAPSEQHPEDVEEKFEKVVLENISLAGLISDLILPSSSEETHEVKEIPQTEQKAEAEKVQELPVEKEPEVKLEAAPELETSAKVEAPSEQHPEDVEEKFEKVVLENISLAGLISDLILPSSSEETQSKEVPKTEQKAEAEKVEELPVEKEPEVKLEAAPELETSAKVEAPSEQHPEDVEEKFEKVVLENISLAGLISDLIFPSSSEETQVKESPQTEQKAEEEKVQELLAEKEPEVKLEAAPELEASVKGEIPSEQHPEDVEETFEKVVLENISLAGLISDLVIPTQPDEKESKTDAPEASEPIVQKPSEVSKLEETPSAISDEFKDVKQWLVFTKDDKEVMQKELTTMLWETSAAEAPKTEETPEQVADEFKDVKQWLVFTKEEPSTAEAIATEKLIEEGGLHAEARKIEPVPPPPQALSSDEYLEPDPEKLAYEELPTDKDSPTTHKKMFGSSLPEADVKEETFKAETSVHFGGDEIGFGEPKQTDVYFEEQFKDFDQPREMPESTRIETTYTYEKTETTVKPEEKKSGGISGFFKSAFSAPVQKLFSDSKDKAGTVVTTSEEFFDVSGDGNESSLQEVIAGTTSVNEPIVHGIVSQEVEETIKTTTQPSSGQETTTTVTKTTTRTQKKRSGKYSKKDKKGSEDHGFEFV